MAAATAYSEHNKPTPTVLCSNCGSYCPIISGQPGDDHQRRIAELEAQVKILTKKASEAADKIADYEDELVRVNNNSPQRRPTTASSLSRSPPREPSTPAPTQSRFGGFLGGRKLSNTSEPGLPRRESDLQAALVKEQGLRQQAEGKVSAMSVEIEDMSAQLFQQANEMVRTERIARAKLEERVAILEKRDGEKRKRLERLEMALKRIDRVKGLLAT